MADIEWQKADFEGCVGDWNLAAVEVLHFVNIGSKEGMVFVEDVEDSKPIVDGAPQEGAVFVAVNLVIYQTTCPLRSLLLDKPERIRDGQVAAGLGWAACCYLRHARCS